MSSSSAIVIKVKFKKTLRRFIASIEDEDEKLALDAVMLREKIRGFFSFDSGVRFTMTYVDEDGDNVTLADNDDLLDIVQQSLNPLRITVKLNKSDLGVPSQTSSSLKSCLPFQFETLNFEVGSLNSKKKEIQVKKVTEGEKFKDVPQPPKGVDLNVPYFQNQSCQAPINATTGVVEGSTGKNKEATDGVEKKKDSGSEKKKKSQQMNQMGTAPINATTGVVEGSTGKNKEATDGVEKKKDSGSEKKKESQQMNQMGTKMAITFSKPDDSGSSSGILKATNQSPFVMLPKNSVVSPNYKNYLKIITPSKVQSGVRCDVCGVNPISGARFKSKVKENYNLCRICFVGTGTQTLFSRPYDPFLHVPLPTLSQALKNRKSDVFRSKLNSSFLLDVNVPDGTIMAPSTKFTKIWRMWNNGQSVWPQGTQLQWVSGDRLGSSDSVNVEIPLFGVPVDKELDIAVNFIASELLGSYVSYWRMASPSGQKFGQQVWVMIKVDASVKELGETSINLNLPPVGKNPEEVVNQDPGNNLIKVTDSDATSVVSKPNDQEMNFPSYDYIIDDDNEDEDDDNEDEDEDEDDVSSTTAILSPAAVAAMSSLFDSAKVETALNSLPEGLDSELISYPTVDSSVMPSTMVNFALSSSSAVPSVQPSCPSSQDISAYQEKTLLEDLEQMGFEQMDLNRKILRRNNYDLEKSIDDLCGVSEWDPMLDDLEEMGFVDEEANRELLKKNNGSISRVVLDLINGKRD